MALTLKSTDELLSEMTDVYDSFIAPKRVWRGNNNKLYLVIRSIAAGYSKLLDAIIALRNRFHPLYCDDVDLYSTAYMVGTSPRLGSGSIVNISITNRSTLEPKTLYMGTYTYTAASGMVFSFQIAVDALFNVLEQKIVSAISAEKGAFHVTAVSNIRLSRTDGASIDAAFSCSCADNAGQLGYPDEDAYAFRQRILREGDRQDHIRELELKIRNLPNIFECNLKLNQSTAQMVYDDIVLDPMELLVTISGVPTDAIARLVAEHVLYATHMSDSTQVVYYENEQYADGKYPVYYRYHDHTEFALDIIYQYDSAKLKTVQVEDTINALLDKYRHAVQHIAVISERLIYDDLRELNLPNVVLLDVNLKADQGGAIVQIPYLTVPVTRLPRLIGVSFSPLDVNQ
jgi:hypothetical protein